MERDEGIYMSKRGQLVFETVSEFIRAKLTRREVSELLSLSERSISRIARRIENRGMLGVIHGNRGRQPPNKRCEEFKTVVMDLVAERYFDFNMRHCLEVLKSDHGLEIPYESFRRWCHESKLVKHRQRRPSKARYKRVRMANEGLLLQMDGSPHRYNGKDEWCLIAAIDDATSDIPYGEFFHSEDTINCMTVLQRIIEKKGIPYAVYVDNAGNFTGGKRAHFSQFTRACEELDIRVIAASSPQAKGRIERAWKTIQDRLIPEMRLRKIHRMPAANDYLQNQFLPNYWNKTLTVKPKSPESRYKLLHDSQDLREILCLKEYRSVKSNHTLSWKGVEYLVESPLRHSIYKQKIEFRTYQDLSWKSFFAGKPIDLLTIETENKTKSAA